MVSAPLRLRLDSAALVDNWRALAAMAGTACGAAVKADGYGLGAVEVARRLAREGCRDFFVATWAEAAALAPLGVPVSVLHGVREEDMAMATTGAMAGLARPVLDTATQVARWKAAAGTGGAGRCDVMVDTGMNRLGVSIDEVRGGLLDGLEIETLMSHLACADEDSTMNAAQRTAFAALAGVTQAKRLSLANSAGIGLGRDYAFDLVRPGLALYGGVPRANMAGALRQVATPEAQVLQRRRVRQGETVGYNATWTAPADTEVAILNLGYADGYFRGFSDKGTGLRGRVPVIGRVSMDLMAVCVDGMDVGEGDWIALDFVLPDAAALTGMSQYELLTSMGARYDRCWV